MKNVEIILSDKAEIIHEYLENNWEQNKTARIIFNGISYKTQLIRDNIHFGNGISKKLIPFEYIRKFKLRNLYRVELPLFWRMLYTIQNKDDIIYIFILDILDHKQYNKLFGYK